ncbi:MAG: RNA polymerase sigma factor RpoD/SigA [Bacteroidetes bacterium]|jgi:RNA polymerase primary sigma factor|nr:RNA polymerase sigma factor RpoD/SigA [Bacteroidota bacterium]
MRSLVISKNITPREYTSLDKYFNEVEKIHLLSPDEETSLAKRIKQGDNRAKDRLVNANLRFVISVAKQYMNQGINLEDLINEGNIGLMIAAGRYDETKGFRFISYAVWWIRQSIIRAISEHARLVRLPYNQLNQISRLYKVWQCLEQEYVRTPCVEELAENMEVSADVVAQLLSKSQLSSVSIDEPFTCNDKYALIDVLHSDEFAPDHLVVGEAVTKEVKQSMRVLSKRDRELLRLYFGFGSFSPMTLEEIGNRFNISKEHAGRLKERALDKLRKCSNAPILRSCLS